MLPTTTTFDGALHLARAAEEQERQLGAMHPRQLGQGKHSKEKSGQTLPGSHQSKVHRVVQGTKMSGATSAIA